MPGGRHLGPAVAAGLHALCEKRPSARPPGSLQPGTAPRAFRRRRHLGSAVRPGSRGKPAPGCPGCPPRLRSLRRSRSETCRSSFRSALRRSRASMESSGGGVPEVVLSDPSRRSSPATFTSSRRYCSRKTSSSARSIAFSASLASTTAPSRASSSRCEPAPAGDPGSPDTNPDHAQPQPRVQAAHAACHATTPSRKPLNGHNAPAVMCANKAETLSLFHPNLGTWARVDHGRRRFARQQRATDDPRG
jgi:hypothetical protein